MSWFQEPFDCFCFVCFFPFPLTNKNVFSASLKVFLARFFLARVQPSPLYFKGLKSLAP